MRKFLLFAAMAAFSMSSAFAQTNLVKNGDFEEWDTWTGNPKEWSRDPSADVMKFADAQSGTASAGLIMEDFSGDKAYIQQEIQLEAGKKYAVSFYYKVKYGNMTQLSASASYKAPSSVFPVDVFYHSVETISKDGWNKVEFDHNETEGRKITFMIFARSEADPLDAPKSILIDNVVIAESGATSIDTDAIGTAVSVYPNPTTDMVSVNGVENVSALEVYSLSGQIVASAKATSSINVSNLSAGTYTLLIKSEGAVIAKKIVKK